VKILQVVTIMVVSVAMALSLAHTLELPGKLRLTKEQYLAIQQIYYPGFSYGGSSKIPCKLGRLSEPCSPLFVFGFGALSLTEGDTLCGSISPPNSRKALPPYH
jgi:hypothetical protein